MKKNNVKKTKVKKTETKAMPRSSIRLLIDIGKGIGSQGPTLAAIELNTAKYETLKALAALMQGRAARISLSKGECRISKVKATAEDITVYVTSHLSDFPKLGYYGGRTLRDRIYSNLARLADSGILQRFEVTQGANNIRSIKCFTLPLAVTVQNHNLWVCLFSYLTKDVPLEYEPSKDEVLQKSQPKENKQVSNLPTTILDKLAEFKYITRVSYSLLDIKSGILTINISANSDGNSANDSGQSIEDALQSIYKLFPEFSVLTRCQIEVKYNYVIVDITFTKLPSKPLSK